MAKGTAGEGGKREREGRGRERTHVRDRRGLRSYIISASVYRSGARANQTDIIDLTCDLEIRKITDGERLEPIIIVNVDRPSSHSSAVVLALSRLGQSYPQPYPGDHATSHSLRSTFPLPLHV